MSAQRKDCDTIAECFDAFRSVTQVRTEGMSLEDPNQQVSQSTETGTRADQAKSHGSAEYACTRSELKQKQKCQCKEGLPDQGHRQTAPFCRDEGVTVCAGNALHSGRQDYQL